MKNSYTSDLTKTHYDAIIIGSGMGGLTTAVFLAKAGKKVLVLERHYVSGGFTHTFKRKKYQWDVGVHYVGQMNIENSMLRKSFDFLSNGKLKWADMGDVYDHAIIEGDHFDFRKGYENQVKQMVEYFPVEKEAIEKYYSLVKKLGIKASLFFSERSMPNWLSCTAGFFLRKGFYKYANQSTYDVLRTLTSNEKLISVLCAQCGNYGLAPRESSFAVHALVVEHFLDGGSYPVGGSDKIHKSFTDEIEAHGGKIVIKAEVQNIIIENNKAIGVLMANGDKLFAKKIISNTGAHNTFNILIPEEKRKKENSETLNKIKPSVSHICIYVGLDASDEELKIPKHNIWLYDSYDFDKQFNFHLENTNSVSPLTYISFPSAKDPEWKINHSGTSTIQVVASFPYHWAKQWENEQWQKRGLDYETMKEEIKNVLLQKLYKTVPQVKGRVVVCELSTPLSTRHFSNYSNGEIYGLEHSSNRFNLRQLRANTNYKNLYLTGQDIVCVGVGSALFSGIITSTAILKRNLMWKILRYKTV